MTSNRRLERTPNHIRLDTAVRVLCLCNLVRKVFEKRRVVLHERPELEHARAELPARAAGLALHVVPHALDRRIYRMLLVVWLPRDSPQLFGQRIVNSGFTLALMVGISVHDTTLGTTVANLGWDEVRFPAPLFHGDTIRVESEVLELRESKSRPQNGVVIFAHRAYNQKNELVAVCKRSGLMLRKPK